VTNLVFLCTGNAARSVMGGAIVRARRDDIQIVTAGTHVIEGMPMSWRTRDALGALDVGAEGHRSYQLRDGDVAVADLVIAMAGEHVGYVRRVHPQAAARTVTLKRLARDLQPGAGDQLAARVAALDLADVALEPWEDVEDPAGGDLPEFEACAREIRDLLEDVLPRL
jgi:protein-tyrosine-phosphatase